MKEKKVYFNRGITCLISCIAITKSFTGPRNAWYFQGNKVVSYCHWNISKNVTSNTNSLKYNSHFLPTKISHLFPSSQRPWYLHIPCAVTTYSISTWECDLIGKGLCRWNRLRWGHTGFAGALNPVTGAFTRGEDTQRHKKEGHVKTDTEIWEMQLQAKDHQEMPGAARSQEKARKDSSLKPSEGTWPWPQLDFRHLASSTWKNKFLLF